jgi:hypothetical protein
LADILSTSLFTYLSNREDYKDHILFAGIERKSKEWEYDHGRNEVRKCSILPLRKCLVAGSSKPVEWPENLIKIESSRQIKDKLIQQSTRLPSFLHR